MRKIDSIIIHCSDSSEDNPDTPKVEGDFGVENIEAWHKERAKTEPWTHYVDHNGEIRYIGYHWVIKRDGTIEIGRPESEIGCHCKGMNKSSIGVCWIGRNHMTDKQRGAMVQAIAELCVSHGLSHNDVYGHNQFSKKTCPNFDSLFTFESMEHFRRIVEMAIRELK